ncbi:hypothetical protein C1T31_07180 [Hanstruepera neustonica]|uniref:Serine kinase n=1 Tax=Hanstruepera neustonica TaxID=1445657 RepID=A0A2K1DZ45_9FLAO|nr:hypothetical protein [Hanstruepera neustonica]PNQ73295.1 hypothetical protein C1T31_07180 [Hanstruepera neustonica]
MNSELAPKYIRQINGKYVLWFEYSNRYILLEEETMHLMDIYFDSQSKDEFISSLKALNTKNYYRLFDEIDQLIIESREYNPPKINENISLINPKGNWITKNYNVDSYCFRINYSIKNIQKILHPQIAHLETKNSNGNFTEFHVALNDDYLHLYKNLNFCNSFPKSQFHLLQGQFAMELLCALTQSTEDDWLGTFHASTVANNNEAIMLIGESGKGKSTLSAILMSNGFKLLADDFTPVMAKSKLIYHYPSAVSIKEGSFEILQSLIDNFHDFQAFKSLGSKGSIKYIAPNDKSYQKPLPCNKIVLVNYEDSAPTLLEETPIETILNTLIPDSWLSPKAENAEHFLNWLETLTFYKLTYSNNIEVIEIFKDLFKTN